MWLDIVRFFGVQVVVFFDRLQLPETEQTIPPSYGPFGLIRKHDIASAQRYCQRL
jgi:hypothetical protein